MPKIGLSRQYVAKRNYDPISQTATFTEGRRLARIVNYSTDISTSDSNADYADNINIEDAGGEFSSGTLSVEVAELSPDDGEFIIGMESTELTVGDKTVKIYSEGNIQNPELGWGSVEKWQVNNAIKWRAVVLPRIKFNVPGDEVATQGESIEWQHDTIEGNIMREQQGENKWRIKSELLDTEDEADAVLRAILNISAGDATLSSLSLGSVSLSPTFSPSVTAYTATTTNATNTITAVPSSGAAVVTITANGSPVSNGSTITWTTGENTVSIGVVDGVANKTYTIIVTKE
ncbi:cadherin-like beta sandwich domain-containing protein [Ruminococcaceae bacterium OttesenSCG-928-A16]|nr:cadherin-like beta sandwich domain-containing protein [Ruminococcaceae bacterium OttesenSCG-928-A16]